MVTLYSDLQPTSFEDFTGRLWEGRCKRRPPHTTFSMSACTDMKFIHDDVFKLLLISVAKTDGDGNFISPAIDL